MATRMMSPVIKKRCDRSDECNKMDRTQQITINSGANTRAMNSRKYSTTDGEALRVFKAVSPGLLSSPGEALSNEDEDALIAITNVKSQIQMNVNLKQQFSDNLIVEGARNAAQPAA